MTIYRGTGGTGDSSTGEDVFGSNGSITDLTGLTGPLRTPTYIALDTEAGHTALVGEVCWNSNEGTLDVGLNGGAVTLQVGQEVHYRVTNQSGASIADGTLVVYSGTTGNSGRLLIEPYNGTQASKYIIGITTETIANGADGYVTHFGKVRGIQTNGANYGEVWNDADELYPSPLGLTNVLPVAPAAKQVIGIVINSHSTNGEIVVNVQGHTSLEDDELVHLDTLTEGDILQYDSTDERFENRSLTAAGIQPTLVSGTNIKTVNSTSLVGSGDVQVQAYDANLTSFVDTFTLPTADSTNGFVLTTNGAGTLSLNAPGGIADGDKGDITVSGGGTVWNIDSGVVTTTELGGDITTAGKALLDDADATAQRTTLGLGALATQGDGDKGDITVSASGATWSIDSAAISQAKIGTNVAGTGPAFSARNNVAQSITNSVVTKVTLGTEVFDTNSNFASSRFTPTVAGYYQINGVIRAEATNLTNASCYLYVNGTQYRQGQTLNIGANTVEQVVISDLVLLNGSTDYVELYGLIAGTSPSFGYNSATIGCSFSGCLVRAS